MKGFQLALVAGLLLLGACTSDSGIFDNNCSGTGGLASTDYCVNDFKPHSGPWAGR